MKPVDFRNLVDIAVTEASQENPRDLVAKEILHYDILHAMSQGGFLDRWFQ